MANHASAVKRAKQTIKKNARNKALKSKARNQLKTSRTVLSKGVDAATATKEVAIAMKEVYQAISKGVLKKATASRYIARLSKLAAKNTK